MGAATASSEQSSLILLWPVSDKQKSLRGADSNICNPMSATNFQTVSNQSKVQLRRLGDWVALPIETVSPGYVKRRYGAGPGEVVRRRSYVWLLQGSGETWTLIEMAGLRMVPTDWGGHMGLLTSVPASQNNRFSGPPGRVSGCDSLGI